MYNTKSKKKNQKKKKAPGNGIITTLVLYGTI